MNSIIKIKSFRNITHKFGPNDLVAIDLDETVFVPKLKVLRAINLPKGKEFMNDVRSQVGNLKFIELFDKLPYMLIEEEIKPFLTILRESQVATIGFTARRPGKWTSNDPRFVEDKTIDILNELDIKFNPIHYTDYVMTGFNTDNPQYANGVESKQVPFEIKSDAMIKSGVVFTNNVNKGVIMCEILDKFKSIPKVFSLIDNEEDNLLALKGAIDFFNETYCSNIQFIGYHYTGATDLLDNSLNENVIQLQKRKLIEEHIYLLDNEMI
jgi:hypothetical protein